MLVDAISFLVSAISLSLIRKPEPPRPARTTHTPIRTEIAEGLRLVASHPILIPLTLRSVIAHVAGSFYGVLYTIYLIDELHLSPFALGRRRLGGRRRGADQIALRVTRDRPAGIGPALIWAAAGASLVGILTPLAGGPEARAGGA
jgi:hypothetical protein